MVLAGGVLLALAAQSSEAFAASWAPGLEAGLPANAALTPIAYLTSVSCASAGNCSAVGYYYDGSVSQQGLLLTETAGTWATGVEASPPANAGSNPAVHANSASCAAAGNCSAVGSYTDNARHGQGLLLTETTGIAAAPPASAGPAPAARAASVSCASAGNCSAVGSYEDGSGHQRGLLLTETAGTWATAVEAGLPANAATTPAVNLTSVSCAAAGNCSAVGYYNDSSGHLQGLLLSETAGTWSAGIEASLPANAASDPSVELTSVSCASHANCSAVGFYTDSSNHEQVLMLTETAHTWATGVEASLPANAATDPGAALYSVSCPSAGNCSAIGYYNDSLGSSQGLLLRTLHRLSVLKAGSGRGSVTSSPAGINCGASCSRGFASGRLVTLTARPARGSGFAGWSGACSGKGGCRVKMTADRTVTARFAH